MPLNIQSLKVELSKMFSVLPLLFPLKSVGVLTIGFKGTELGHC